MTLRTLREINNHNLQTFRRNPVSEISGAVGDLGTFLPIVIALTVNKTISLPSTLIFSGVFNILTGLFFGIPLPVQPMKAIASVAIANSFSGSQIAAAGLFVGACIFALSVTGILRWFSAVVPIPVVKGIQVGAGLSLIIASGTNLRSSLSWISPSWADNLILATLAFLFLLVTNIYRRVPYALIIFAIGLIFALILSTLSGPLPHFRFWHPYVVIPGWSAWKTGGIDAGIGQIPLTTLNSVIAVVHLSADLLPSIKTPSITSVGLSVAGMNLVGCWFGAMPVCHGSGGLAAQYRFGARSGASVVFLGVLKLVIGLFFGQTLVGLLEKFPGSLLGVMVIAAGLELASVGESLNTSRARDIGKPDSASEEGGGLSGIRSIEGSTMISDDERKKRWTVMLVTIGLLVAFKNDGVGFLAGMLCYWSYELPRLYKWLSHRLTEGRIRLEASRRNSSRSGLG